MLYLCCTRYHNSNKVIKMFVCSKTTCWLKNKLQNIEAFRPSGGERTAKKRKLFDDIIQKEDWDMDALNKVRCKRCIRCREIVKRSNNNPNTTTGQCKFFYKKMREEAVCEVCSSSENIEFDHLDPSKKTHSLSSYMFWSCNGGVNAMKEEFKKCRPLCRMCHDQHTQKTHKRKYASADEMPTFTQAEKQAKRQRQYTDDKAAYVLSLKMAIGGCEHCQVSVNPKNSRSFHFAHKNAAEKLYNVSNLVSSYSATLKTAKPKIDAEVKKCLLLCCDCHKKITKL